MVYLPEYFAETDIEALHGLIREFPLGTLITLGSDGLTANHIPFVLDARAGAHGRLLAHVARSFGWHVSVDQIRYSESTKAQVCRAIGFDNRVQEVCAPFRTDGAGSRFPF